MTCLKYIIEQVDPVDPPRPCDCFDLIAGEGTGGLIAIMLGRLQMHLNQAISAFQRYLDATCTTKRDQPWMRLTASISKQSIYDGDSLRRSVQEILRDYNFDENELLKGGLEGGCNA